MLHEAVGQKVRARWLSLVERITLAQPASRGTIRIALMLICGSRKRAATLARARLVFDSDDQHVLTDGAVTAFGESPQGFVVGFGLEKDDAVHMVVGYVHFKDIDTTRGQPFSNIGSGPGQSGGVMMVICFTCGFLRVGGASGYVLHDAVDHLAGDVGQSDDVGDVAAGRDLPMGKDFVAGTGKDDGDGVLVPPGFDADGFELAIA